MTTRLIDLSRQPIPLRLLRVQQLRAHQVNPLLEDDFVPELDFPSQSESERYATTERLLYARRRAAS